MPQLALIDLRVEAIVDQRHRIGRDRSASSAASRIASMKVAKGVRVKLFSSRKPTDSSRA